MAEINTANQLVLDVQLATKTPEACPSLAELENWCQLALQTKLSAATDLTLRFVDNAESQELNFTYRNKNKPTNVLSFPFSNPIDLPPEARLNLLGDLVLCVPLIAQEALEQQKAPLDHWAHLVIHGVLHLQGYDHQEAAEAETMENLEVELLAKLDIANPYAC